MAEAQQGRAPAWVGSMHIPCSMHKGKEGRNYGQFREPQASAERGSEGTGTGQLPKDHRPVRGTSSWRVRATELARGEVSGVSG